jgi:nicotinate-nucleotide adenylyltransferase
MNRKTIALFGGSFDPIHQGHLGIAQDIQDKMHFDRFIFLPCGQPALKGSCHASPKARLAMLELALKTNPEFEISNIELFEPGKTYTIETLKKFRHILGEDVSLSFILGADTMAQIMQWHNWTELLNNAHLIYHQRPMLAYEFSDELKSFILKHQIEDLTKLKTQAHGLIYQLNSGNYPISSTQIRNSIAQNKTAQGLNESVLKYIEKHQIYQS